MATQKALLLKQAKTPLVLVGNHVIPQPSRSQVQVKVLIAGLNGHDQKVRDLGIFLARIGTPAILANDVVGKVTKTGEDVTSLHEGDRVVFQADFAQGTLQNGLQEYAVADARFTAKVPESISNDEAATLPTNIIATLVALFHDLPIPAPWTSEAKQFDYRSATLLIVGGGSIAGRYAVQLARLAGIGRIVVVGGSEDELRRYGATHVLDRHATPDVLVKRIGDLVGDDLIYAYDPVNFPEGQLVALNALSSHSKGYLARLLPMPVDESKVIGKKAGFEIKNTLGISSERASLCEEFWTRLPGYLEQKQIVPIQSGYETLHGLDAEKVNGLLNAFRDGKKLKHANVHL